MNNRRGFIGLIIGLLPAAFAQRLFGKAPERTVDLNPIFDLHICDLGKTIRLYDTDGNIFFIGRVESLTHSMLPSPQVWSNSAEMRIVERVDITITADINFS